MAGLLGKIDEFNNQLEEWQQYEQRLDDYFTANGVTDADKKRSILNQGCQKRKLQADAQRHPSSRAKKRRPTASWLLQCDNISRDHAAVQVSHKITKAR